MTDSQAQFMEHLLRTLEASFLSKDLQAMEGLFRHGASMARRILDGKEEPLNPESSNDGLS